MDDLYAGFEDLPELEDTVSLDEVGVMEDDFHNAEQVIHRASEYGLIPDVKYDDYQFQTRGGKTVVVYHDKMGSMWSIKFKQGGQLPEELEGKFTSEQQAIQAVEIYLAKAE